MREPDLHTDGWRLEDGEKRHAEYSDSFEIPDAEIRNILQPGDFAKLIFSIAVDGQDEPSQERMWVIVSRRFAGGYLGILDNDPDCIEQNEDFWSGIELPFKPQHIIDVRHGNSESLAVVSRPVARPWQ